MFVKAGEMGVQIGAEGAKRAMIGSINPVGAYIVQNHCMIVRIVHVSKEGPKV